MLAVTERGHETAITANFMPKEITAHDPRSFEDEEDYRRAEMGAGASCNGSGPDPSTQPPGKFKETYDGADGPGFVTNTKV